MRKNISTEYVTREMFSAFCNTYAVNKSFHAAFLAALAMAGDHPDGTPNTRLISTEFVSPASFHQFEKSMRSGKMFHHAFLDAVRAAVDLSPVKRYLGSPHVQR